jgi:molybdopterin synthase sulfur carrier subunit
MKIQVYFFAQVRELAHSSQTELEIKDGTTVAALIADLKSGLAGLGSVDFKIAVNNEYVQDDRVLVDGDRVAIIPPISGG